MSTSRERYPDYPTMLEVIRKRPGMFFAKPSVYGLKIFLEGFTWAESYHELADSDRMAGFDWDKFEDWVAEKYNPRRLSLNSFGLAEQLASSDGQAFYMWFGWYDEFLKKE